MYACGTHRGTTLNQNLYVTLFYALCDQQCHVAQWM